MAEVSEVLLNKKETISEVEAFSYATSPARVIILIPGIRTNAEWTDETALHCETFSEPVKSIKAIGGRISSFHLMTRIGLSRIRQEIIIQIYQAILEYKGSEISLVCHSMGTDIISDILPDIKFKFKYIFFIGGICSEKKAGLIRDKCECFVNHKGSHDEWPIIASIFRPWNYSPTGTFGFGRGIWVNEIIYANNHFTCTRIDHIKNNIIPIIMGLNAEAPRGVRSIFKYNVFFYVRAFACLSFLSGIFGLYFSYWSMLIPAISAAVIMLVYNLKSSRTKLEEAGVNLKPVTTLD